ALGLMKARFWLPTRHCRIAVMPVNDGGTVAGRPSRGRSAAGPVAQWLEPAAHNGLVAGSSPAGPTSLRSLRELRLGKPAHDLSKAKRVKAVSPKPVRAKADWRPKLLWQPPDQRRSRSQTKISKTTPCKVATWSTL